jgi:N-terminal domain of toast_rack, DUF2154
MQAGFLLIAVGSACLAGCGINVDSGPPRHETRAIERDTSETARVDLEMGAGELRVDGGARELMQADFNYSVPAFKPELRYHSFAGRADLTIRQPVGGGVGRHGTSGWDVRFTDDIPIDFLLHFGAGEAHLDLGSLNLRSVEVEMGVGQIRMDLRGMPKRDYDVRIRGGVGEATVYLPVNAGVYAKAEGGLGQIEVSGLRRESYYWVNQWYDSAKPQVRVDVEGGIGRIKLIGE